MNIRHKRTYCNVENVYAELVLTTREAYEFNEGDVNVAEELKKMRETRFGKKVSMNALAKELGLAGASSYQRYEDATAWENKKFPSEFVAKLLEVWRGKGQPPIDSDEILRLGNLYEFVIKEFSEPILLSGVRGGTISRELPLLTAKQVEMFAAKAVPEGYKENYVGNRQLVGTRPFRLVVTDRSMEPVFQEGDELICEPDSPVEPGDYVVAKLQSELIASIRQYRLLGYDENQEPIIELIPANPNYPRARMAADTPGQIFAVVVKFTRAIK